MSFLKQLENNTSSPAATLHIPREVSTSSQTLQTVRPSTLASERAKQSEPERTTPQGNVATDTAKPTESFCLPRKLDDDSHDHNDDDDGGEDDDGANGAVATFNKNEKNGAQPLISHPPWLR